VDLSSKWGKGLEGGSSRLAKKRKDHLFKKDNHGGFFKEDKEKKKTRERGG